MKPQSVAAIYCLTLVLSLLSTLGLPLFSQITPVYAATSLPTHLPEATASEATLALEERPFFLLGRDALNFSKFAQRDQLTPRRDPYQIIEAVRQRHQDTSQDISVKESIQRLRAQIPQQSNQLRNQVNELPDRLKASAGRANTSIRRSIETTATSYLDERRFPPFLARIKSDIYQVQRRLKALAVSFLEQTSHQIDRAAQRLKR